MGTQFLFFTPIFTITFNEIYIIIGLFYYTAGNIKPVNRSQLGVTQLLAIATRPVIKKYGTNAILEKFMSDLSYLEQVQYLYI